MKNKVLLFLAIFTILSCTQDEESNQLTTSEKVNLLTSNIWKKDYYETFYYYNDVLDHSVINTLNANNEQISFTVNYNVNYINPAFIQSINGIWSLDANEEFLITNLKKVPPSSSGFGTIYYFPYNKISELTNSKLSLDSQYLYFSFSNSSGQIINGKEFTRYNFIH